MGVTSRATVSLLACQLAALAFVGSAFAAPAQSIPTFDLAPTSGPVGTPVHFTGQVDPSQIDAFQNPSYFTLTRDIEGCELVVTLQNKAITVDASGAVSGSFVVGGTGQCFQTDSSRPVVDGTYNLAISCHACSVGSFTVTGTFELARTGGSSLPLAVAGLALIAFGAVLVRAGRVEHAG